MNFEKIKEQADNALMPTYAHQNAAIVRGKGATLEDADGREFIDFTSGIGVVSLGFADEKWAEAVAAQAKSVQHISNLYYNPTVAEFAEKLCEKSGFERVFLCNSGAEANECALKLARKYSFDRYGEGRNTVITLKNSFHGRTMATLTATGQDHYHNFFFPFNEGFKYAEAGNIKELDETADEKVCAVVMELIQGEGGVMPIDPEYVKAAAEICGERDILLIFDEVQTGVGRTGYFYLWEKYGIRPDILTSAKGLGNGLPIGACLCKKELSGVLTPGTHGTTFGGNPIACAGGLEVLKRVDDKLLSEVKEKGEYIRNKLSKIPEVDFIRGEGLMIGIGLKTKTAAEVCGKCTENGLLILTAKALLRMLPPLTISYEEIDKGIEILKNVLEGE